MVAARMDAEPPETKTVRQMGGVKVRLKPLGQDRDRRRYWLLAKGEVRQSTEHKGRGPQPTTGAARKRAWTTSFYFSLNVAWLPLDGVGVLLYCCAFLCSLLLSRSFSHHITHITHVVVRGNGHPS